MDRKSQGCPEGRQEGKEDGRNEGLKLRMYTHKFYLTVSVSVAFLIPTAVTESLAQCHVEDISLTCLSILVL